MTKPVDLKKIRLFQGLSDPQLKAIHERGEDRMFAAGDTLFGEGDEGHHLYCLVSGRVELTLSLGDVGQQAPVHTATQGSVFGEFLLFEPCHRSATARALKPAEVFAVEPGALDALFNDDPTLGYRVMRNLCQILIGRMSKTTRELRSSLMW